MIDNGAKTASLNAGGSYTIPVGYHNGSGKVTANSLASQTSGTADAGAILTGRTAWVNGEKLTGYIPNLGGVNRSLNCGESYTIQYGYHNGGGKVTANSLSSQTPANASAGYILTGYNAWVNGSKINGSMPNRGSAGTSLNCGGSYTIPAGYHNGSGKVTANSLASQTSANAAASHIRSGYTAWVNGAKITGNLAIQSALSFSAAALSATSVRISWKNPSKGPWQGVFIQMSTSGYPGTGGGSRVYTGAGNNPSSAGGSNYVDIGGLAFGTTYYFTCTSYVDALGWGNSYNVSATTPAATLQDIISWYAGTPNYSIYHGYYMSSSNSSNYTASPGGSIVKNQIDFSGSSNTISVNNFQPNGWRPGFDYSLLFGARIEAHDSTKYDKLNTDLQKFVEKSAEFYRLSKGEYVKTIKITKIGVTARRNNTSAPWHTIICFAFSEYYTPSNFGYESTGIRMKILG